MAFPRFRNKSSRPRFSISFNSAPRSKKFLPVRLPERRESSGQSRLRDLFYLEIYLCALQNAFGLVANCLLQPNNLGPLSHHKAANQGPRTPGTIAALGWMEGESLGSEK